MKLKISCRIFDDRGEKAFGAGVASLLRRIEDLGSLNKASKSMDLSYSKAWRILDNAEKKLGIQFVDRTIGGQKGGGSRLTSEGLAFLETYERFSETIKSYAQETFDALFGDGRAVRDDTAV